VRRLPGDAGTAIDQQRAALAVTRETNGESSRHTELAHHFLARALRDSGYIKGAERSFRAAAASHTGYIPQAEHPLAATSRNEPGLLLIQCPADRAEGIRLLTEATSLREKFLGADEPCTKQAREALAKA